MNAVGEVQFDEAAHPDPEKKGHTANFEVIDDPEPSLAEQVAAARGPVTAQSLPVGDKTLVVDPAHGSWIADALIMDDPEFDPDTKEGDALRDGLAKFNDRWSLDPAFIHFSAACREINEPKVSAQLARLVQAGALPDKNLWKTNQRHQVVPMAVARCKNPDVIRNQWAFLCFQRGSSIGNRALEVQLFISWVLLGLVTELFFETLISKTTVQQPAQKE